MATIHNTKRKIDLSKSELKYMAVFEVLKWASLNEGNIDEDFYHNMYLNEIPKFMGTELSQTVKFTKKEKMYMNAEFKIIARILRKRLLKYKAKSEIEKL